MFQLQILMYWLFLLLLQRSLRSDHSLYIAWRQKKSGLEDAYYLCEAITLPARKELHFPDFSVLCQQAKRVGKKNKCSFRLVTVEDGLYSLEYDPSMSMIQAFSICVAVVSSHKLTHIFQVNYVRESKELSENIRSPMSDKNVKIREEFVSKPPASHVGKV
ncbi:hypothetical protein HanPSC8_Chr15g0660011 [Helianthus annuus]|nr:hypothetical protein HanPSC8_Chr15g0660011 [Helianthus annuus]